MLPFQRETPRIAKIMKKNIAKPMIPLRLANDESSVPISNFIDGIVYRLLKGLNNLKVRRPDTLFIDGSEVSNDEMTTAKSIQFQASLR